MYVSAIRQIKLTTRSTVVITNLIRSARLPFICFSPKTGVENTDITIIIKRFDQNRYDDISSQNEFAPSIQLISEPASARLSLEKITHPNRIKTSVSRCRKNFGIFVIRFWKTYFSSTSRTK